jgi:hypothetical protein
MQANLGTQSSERLLGIAAFSNLLLIAGFALRLRCYQAARASTVLARHRFQVRVRRHAFELKMAALRGTGTNVIHRTAVAAFPQCACDQISHRVASLLKVDLPRAF